MEEEKKYYQSDEIPDSMKNYHTNIQDALNNKFDIVKCKLDVVQLELENYVLNELCEIGSMNNEITLLQEKLKEKNEDKNILVEVTKSIKVKINNLLKKVEKIEKLGPKLSDIAIDELITVEDDEFNLIKINL